MKAEEIEPCDHHRITDVQLGDYVECELCGLIFPRKDWGKIEDKKKIMTKEEIEKAARLCAMGYTRYEGKTNREIDLEQSDFSNIFKAGVEFSNKHWHEKTRWIPIEERLPETYPLEGVIGLRVGMQVLTLSHEGSNVAILHDMGNGKPYWMLNSGKELHGVTHWKEID